MYYSYHAMAKKRIREGHLIHYELMERWGNIAPALVLFFDDHRPMPIRAERIAEYADLLSLHLIRDGDPEQGE